jgi:hypothetical protein
MQHYTGIEEASLVPVVTTLCDLFWNSRLSTFSSILTKFETAAMHRVSVSVPARLPQSLRFDCLRRGAPGGVERSPEVSHRARDESEDMDRRLLNCTPEPSEGGSTSVSEATPDDAVDQRTGGKRDEGGDEEATDTDEPVDLPAASGGTKMRGAHRRPGVAAAPVAGGREAVDGIGIGVRRGGVGIRKK